MTFLLLSHLKVGTGAEFPVKRHHQVDVQEFAVLLPVAEEHCAVAN